MKQTLYSVFILISLQIHAQIGIGTDSPVVTLDVREENPNSPTAQAGISIPQVTTLPASGNRAGQIVFLTANNTFCFYNGTDWKPIAAQVNQLGDVKHGLQTADHDGWILLDGRAINSLTPSQQAAATLLGIGTNLPNLADKSIVGASVSKTLNSNGGVSSLTIAQNQLPNVTLTTSTDGNHSHNSGSSANSLFSSLLPLTGTPVLYSTSNSNSTSSSGDHSHTTSSINGGVAQQPISIQNPYLAMNGFVYLGE